MSVAAKTFVAFAALWAVASLAWQVRAARGRSRADHSEPAGSPIGGILYNFTVAMSPAHKESVRHHRLEFAVGALMHAGVIVAMLAVLVLLVVPAVGDGMLTVGRPLIALSLIAGLHLFIRRIRSADLRAMSAPDDYLAILASCGLLAVALFYGMDAAGLSTLMIYTGALLVYLPLGKLRHVAFFFAARGDLGRRLGHRGVYPPAAAEASGSGGGTSG